jgi:hypothetical protein
MQAVCADFETELVEFNGEKDHVHLLVHYPPNVSVSKLAGPSKASPPADSARSTPTTSASTCGARTSGHPHTSRRAAAAPRSASSRSTSRTRNARSSRLRPTAQTHAHARVRAVQRSASSRA